MPGKVADWIAQLPPRFATRSLSCSWPAELFAATVAMIEAGTAVPLTSGWSENSIRNVVAAAVPPPAVGGVVTSVMFRKSHDRTRTGLSEVGLVSVLHGPVRAGERVH